jgi:Fe-S-cluster containining protein
MRQEALPVNLLERPGISYVEPGCKPLPDWLEAELRADVERFKREGWPIGKPCMWYDAETRRCKHYEYRPETCRDFEVGETACLNWRRTFGVDPGEPWW